MKREPRFEIKHAFFLSSFNKAYVPDGQHPMLDCLN